MVKAYVNNNQEFTATNKFQVNIDVNNNKITNLSTPTNAGDAANLSYILNKYYTIYTYNTGEFISFSGSTTDIISLTVDVPSGHSVLLLSHGSTNVFSQIWYRRGTTDLTNNINSRLDVGSLIYTNPWSMYYLDTAPETGNVTYRIRGYTDNNILGRFTVIVFR